MGIRLGLALLGVAIVFSCSDDDDTQPGTGGGPVSSSATGGSPNAGSGGIGGGSGTGGLDCEAILPGICGVPADPPGGECPDNCTSCTGDVCEINCNEVDNICSGETIACPEGFDCSVVCMSNSCTNTTIVCPTSYSCTVTCDWENACQQTEVRCSIDGPCFLDCQNDDMACDGVLVDCGCNKCTAFCEYPHPVVAEFMDCEGSCECENCEPM